MRGRVYTYWPGGGDGRLRYNACNSAIVVVGIYVAMDYNQTSEVRGAKWTCVGQQSNER